MVLSRHVDLSILTPTSPAHGNKNALRVDETHQRRVAGLSVLFEPADTGKIIWTGLTTTERES